MNLPSTCMHNESVNHLFLKCSMAKMMWNIIQYAFDIKQVPDSTQDLFGVWLKQFGKIEKSLVAVGISAVFWTIWKIRNNVVFDKKRISNPCIPVNMMIKMLHDWLVMQINPRSRRIMAEGVRRVEQIAGDIFRATLGWRMANRITAV